MEKVVKLKHVEKLLELINQRDSYNDWSRSYDKYNKKVVSTIEFIKRNAVEIDEDTEYDINQDFEPEYLSCGCCSCCGCSCDDGYED